MSTIRVLQVVQRFSPELGGLETHVAEVTKRLAATGDIEVTVLTTDRTGTLPREDRVNGVRVIRRRSWRKDGEEYFSPGLWRVIRHGGWDLVHVQGSQTTVPTLAMLAARSARIPYLLTFHSGGHNSASHAPITRIQDAINRPLLARAAKLIAVSRFERTKFTRITGLPADRFAVIPNGGALPPVPTGAAPVPGSIVTSGRLERYKGHHRVIAALPLIRAAMPEATLTVLGSGPYEAELRRLAAASGVADAITFRSLLPAERSEMAAILSRSAVLAALSSYEAHPVAVMEAVALGLPVVGCDVAGIGDLVEDGLVAGVPVDADDAQVAEALLRQLRAGDGAPHRAPDVVLPTWEGATEQIADIYRRVLAGRAPTPRSKVVQIITTLTTGGAERQVESIVDHSRHRQHVIALYGGGAVAESLTAAGHSVEVLLRQLRAGDGAPHRAPDVVLPTWEGATEQIADIYRHVLAGRAPAPRSKVVQIITTLTTGGAERQVESIVDHSRHRQHVIALYGGGAVAESLTAAGHSVEVLDLAGPRRLLALPVLVRRLRELQPDTVQVHLLSGQLWGLPAARLARVPLVLSTEHSLMEDSIENRPLTEPLRRLYLALNRLATRTVAVSAATADRLVRWGVRADAITVIDNGIDFARLTHSPAARTAIRAELGIGAETEVVGAVGRLEPVKRLRQLITAIAPTLEVGRRELVIVGDGPLRTALAEQAQALGVADLVHLTGPRADVPALLSAMDVLVSPSRDETFGMAVLEGIGAGLPVVYAQCPALDALPEPVPSAFPIADAGADESDAIVGAVDRALRHAAGLRVPVPAAVREAYDITRTTARLDRLVDQGRRRR